MTRTTKAFYKYQKTRSVYVIERTWSGRLIGSFGPLPEGGRGNAYDYECAPDKNDWVEAQSDKLLLLDEAGPPSPRD